MKKQMETFSFNIPINLVEEGKCLLGVTSFEATNSVFNITNENNIIQNLSHTKFFQAFIHLQTLLKFFQEVSIQKLRWEYTGKS